MKMSCPPEQAQLCRLINHSLYPFAESSQLCTTTLTKEKEKQLLIILSHISKQIPGLQDEHDSEDDKEEVLRLDDFHDCFANIVCQLVVLMNVESKYVRHSTGNVLVGISDFLIESGSNWNEYVHLLCVCLEASMFNILSPATVASETDNTFSRRTLQVQKRMVNANLNTVASVLRVLRTILKHLKQCPGDELLEVYMNSINYCLTNIPWELLDNIHATRESMSKMSYSKDMIGEFGSPVSRFVFLGTLLQLFCSLVHQIGSTEVDTLKEHHVLVKITRLVPKLLYWCFLKHDVGSWISSSQYMRHKILMLMIRLSFHVEEKFSVLVLWLRLLREYFQDLLRQPISGSHDDLVDSLEGSPFLSCVADGQKVHRLNVGHLQRQATLLFLKCSFGLISLGKDIGMKCSCATSDSCLAYELHSVPLCCTWKIGLLELSQWLNMHVPLDMFVDYNLYLEKCRSFASSFLQLYMNEDDFLFEVLLHVSTLPVPVQQMNYQENDKDFKELKSDTIFRLSIIFNSMQLFHLFLAVLGYDHSVLLDYLISKDAGIHCLKYLLRCLRTISNSWNSFLEYPVCGSDTILSSCKKRKFSGYNLESDGELELELVSAIRKRREYSCVLDNGSNTKSSFGGMLDDTRIMTFQNVKDCLLSLKNSIENLNQKNLFPYNPSVLLRSLTRFQELCHQQENVKLERPWM